MSGQAKNAHIPGLRFVDVTHDHSLTYILNGVGRIKPQ